jgi:hypothetical protein
MSPLKLWTLLLFGALAGGGAFTVWAYRPGPGPVASRPAVEPTKQPEDRPAPKGKGAVGPKSEPASLPPLEGAPRLARAVGPPLAGDTLLLVLFTKGSSLTSETGRRELGEQLEAVRKEWGGRLVGGKAFVLTRQGLTEWSPGLAPEERSAFDNRQFAALFDDAFKAVAALTERARDKDFRTILVWETTIDPTGEPEPSPKVDPPAGRDVRLCYRINRDRDSERLAEWFGAAKVGRMKSVGDLRTFVEEYLDD